MKLAPEIINEFFNIIECPYPLRDKLRFKSRNIHVLMQRIEKVAFVGWRVWSYVPIELKQSTSVSEFRSKVKTWKPEISPLKFGKIKPRRIGHPQVTRYILISLYS